MYRWHVDRTVLTARLHVAAMGHCTEGSLVVGPHAGMDIHLPEHASDQQRAAIKDLSVVLGMYTGRDVAFGVDPHIAFSVDARPHHPFGRLYRAEHDPTALTVRVLHGHVSEVTRHIGPSRVSHIVLECAHANDGSSLVRSFARVIRGRDRGGLEAHQTVTIAIGELDGLHMPTSVRVHTVVGEGSWIWAGHLDQAQFVEVPRSPAGIEA